MLSVMNALENEKLLKNLSIDSFKVMMLKHCIQVELWREEEVFKSFWQGFLEVLGNLRCSIFQKAVKSFWAQLSRRLSFDMKHDRCLLFFHSISLQEVFCEQFLCKIELLDLDLS